VRVVAKTTAGSHRPGHSVDYTGAIDSFNECEQWTVVNQWVTCENKDVMEGILYINSKYKRAGVKFECFHNRGHPEISSEKTKDCNALERVAVLSDEILRVE
jgi:hypothetical protein